MHDIAEFLSAHDPFSGLEDEALERLATRVEVEFFTVGTTVFKQGEEPQHEVRMIRRGAVELVDHGRVLDLLGEGEMFGHPSMVSGLPTGFEVRTHEDTLCYSIAAEDVLALLSGPAGLKFLARSLLDRPKPGPVVAADVSGFDLVQQPVGALIRRPPLLCEPDASLREVAQKMTEAGSSSVLVRLGDGEFGIVTDRDLRARVVAEGLSIDDRVDRVMTTPLVSVGPDQNGSDVLLTMLDHGFRHVAVLSARAEVLGVITGIDLLAGETRTPFVLRRAIADAADLEELRRAARRLNPTLIGLHESELAPAQVSAVICVVLDALVRRSIELASVASGPSPTPFTWLALGSHARREAVPSSDIDSGMVWADREGTGPEPYMHAIAEEVDKTLLATGWEPDTHQVLASGSIFARSAGDWQRSIAGWLAQPRANKVAMALSIVIDSRSVYGPERAFDALAQLEHARKNRAVRELLLKLALANRPPTGFMRDVVVEHSGAHRGSFDIKQGGLLPIIDIARYAGLLAGTTARSTPQRLRAGGAAGALREEEARTLEEAYDLFAELRLAHQVHQLEAGTPPDDHVDPRSLNSLTRRYLRDAFRAVSAVQKTLTANLVAPTWDG